MFSELAKLAAMLMGLAVVVGLVYAAYKIAQSLVGG